MPKFKLIEHTTDIGLTAYSRTLAQAFANAAYERYKEGMRVPGLIYAS